MTKPSIADILSEYDETQDDHGDGGDAWYTLIDSYPIAAINVRMQTLIRLRFIGQTARDRMLGRPPRITTAGRLYMESIENEKQETQDQDQEAQAGAD